MQKELVVMTTEQLLGNSVNPLDWQAVARRAREARIRLSAEGKGFCFIAVNRFRVAKSIMEFADRVETRNGKTTVEVLKERSHLKGADVKFIDDYVFDPPLSDA